MEAKLLVFIAIACAVSRIEGQTVTLSSSINITRSGCGTSKLCFPTCDPVANSSTCYFGSSQYQPNTTLYFELVGPTSGYVALGLASDPNVGATIVFVCANNNTNNGSIFFFQTASNTSTGLNLTTVNTVYSVQGAVAINQSLNQSLVKCTFNTSSSLNVSTSSTSTSKASATINYYVTIFSGIVSGTTLGFPTSVYYSGKALNLADPTSNTNTTNSTSSATVAATVSGSTGGSDSLTNPVAHALAILLSAMGLLLLS
ncbi:putative ferric-chelate reductase 1 [Colossoma macropomum]|uniref:putative ferric-chelate reductase 1 n=1 Tax=Colossoma macropomum TaxID=42526 RepID=UPI00186504AC|nr:putative ferric-chelate reductase 1 [Colossoma macropomum]